MDCRNRNGSSTGKKPFRFAKSLLLLVLPLCLMGSWVTGGGQAVEISISRNNAEALSVDAEAALLYDVTEGRVLYEKNATERCEPASLTKLLTVLTAYANGGDSLRYTVGDEIDLVGSNSSIAYLRKGNVLSFEAIVDAVLLSSGNDATYTLAVNVARANAGGSLSVTEALASFAEMMNETAINLGCTDSHFSTVDGYPSPDHYSTAYDLLTIAVEAIHTPLISASVSKSRAYHIFHSGREVVWETTNLLLKKDSPYYYEYATGMKTGSTGEGFSLAASAEKDGVKRIAIVLNAAGDGGRFQDALKLFEAAWEKER